MKKIFSILALLLLLVAFYPQKAEAQTTIGPATSCTIKGHYQNDGLLGGIYIHCDGSGSIDCAVPCPKGNIK